MPDRSTLLDFSALSANVGSSKPSWLSTTGDNVPWANMSTTIFGSKTPNGHETEDEKNYDPHYEPIISLPELIPVKTGEEGEVCIYLRRCRLYRYVDSSWKERGVGEVKVLVRPTTMPTDYSNPRQEYADLNKLAVVSARLLMRREQVLKVCANQPITPEFPQFKPMSGSSAKSLCWYANDFTDGTAEMIQLAIRFKNVADAENFKLAVSNVQRILLKTD